MTAYLRSKKVLLVISSLAGGGAERVISTLANVWAGEGVRVGLLTLSERPDRYSLSPEVERIKLDIMWPSHGVWQSLVSNVRRSWMIRRTVQGFRPDAVLSFIELCNVRVLAALLGSGIPVIVSERNNPSRHGLGRAFDAARKRLYPFARRLVVQTEEVAQGWAHAMVSPEKVAVIPNFVRDDMPEVPPNAQRDPALILAVGRLSKQKGFDVLLDAFARSGLAGRGARLVILGEGGERAPLESLARSLGIAQSVSMPGTSSDPESWMARCGLFVMPSRYEGFPNALLEAMSLGCAALAADCDSGPRDLIEHGRNGWLVPVEDAEATAAALKQLFDDAGLRGRLGHAAVEVRGRFSREQVMQQWEEAVIGAIGGQGKGGVSP